MNNTKFGEHIKKHRTRRGLTQEQLADKIGLSSQAVSKWECDGSIPDALMLATVADALDVSTDRLLGRTAVHETELYGNLRELMQKTPEGMQMQKAREICWQTLKGLFHGVNTWWEKSEYIHDPDEMRTITESGLLSQASGADGFMHCSHQPEAQYFGVFTKGEDGFVLEPYSPRYRTLFVALSDEYVLRAIFALQANPIRNAREKEVLAAEWDIPEAHIDALLAKMEAIGDMVSSETLTINGEERMVYRVGVPNRIWAILIVAFEFLYSQDYEWYNYSC